MSTAAFSQRLRASGIWAASGRIMSGMLLLALHGILARALSGTDYGRYVLIESAALVFSLICMAGIPTVTLRLIRSHLSTGDSNAAVSVTRATIRLFLLTSTVTVFVTTGLAWLALNTLPSFLNWRWMPWILAWAVLSAGLRILSEIYRAYDRYSVAYSIGGQSGGVFVNVSLVALALAAIVSGRITLPTILAIQVFVQLVVLLACSSELRNHMPGIGIGGNRQLMGLLLFSAWPLLAQQLVSIGLPEAGKLLLGFYASPAETGLYNAALRLVVLAHVPLMIVNNAIQPFITELHLIGKKDQLITLVRGSATLAALPCLGVFAAFIFLPEIVLAAVFGPEFTAAASTLRILTLGSLAWVLSGSCGLVLMMTGHERSSMLGTVIPGLIYLILCPWLINHHGLIGAAVASTILQVASNLICMLFVYYHHQFWTGVTISKSTVIDCVHMIQSKRRV